jgi:oxygen-independent coproporphyrinogen-3 oxidase
MRAGREAVTGPGLYVHLPFCPYLCPYCDFAKWPLRRSSAARYLAALEAQIAAAPPFRAATLFFGGGTPNTYPAETLVALVTRLRERFALPADAEVSIEVNPDLALCEGFEAYAAAGINRLSVGVQSLDALELERLGRRHRPLDVVEVLRRARAAGFVNLSIDLMFAVPGQSVDSWRRTLDFALGLDLPHLSTYGLTIEAGTRYAAWHAREPAAFADEDAEAECYRIAIEELGAAGYEQYELSNFARPGFRCAHNANYWANGSYLGLGVGAASYLDGERRTTTRDLERYCAAALAFEPIPADSERLAGAALFGEAAMLALRTSEGVDFAAFAERYGVDFPTYYARELAGLVRDGLIVPSATRAVLTSRGRFVANDACAAFLAPVRKP